MQVCDPLGVALGSVTHSKGGRLSKGVVPARFEGRGLLGGGGGEHGGQW